MVWNVCWRKQGKEGRAERRGIGKTWRQREKRENASDILYKIKKSYAAIIIDKVADCGREILDHLEKQLNSQPCLHTGNSEPISYYH